MPSFPLVYLLIPFGLLVFLGTLFFFFNVFHIKRYAIKSPATTTLLLIYFMSFGLLIALAGGFLLAIDWSEEFEPNDLLPSFNSTSRI